MSRSFKKHPFITDNKSGTTKKQKRFSNKRIRNQEDLPNGGAFKKVSETYNIHDFIRRWTWQEAKEWYLNQNEDDYIKGAYPNLNKFYRYWLKCCKIK